MSYLEGMAGRGISPRCTIQMDLQKAYDTVEWCAVEMIMREINGIPFCFCRLDYDLFAECFL